MPDVLEVLNLAVELEGGVLHVLDDGLELVLAVRVEVLGELLLPRRSFRLERNLERLGLQGERADVVHRGDFADVLLDVHVLLQLSLEHVDVGLLGHERLVRHLEILEVEEVVLGERGEVRFHAGPAAVHGAGEQEAQLDDVDVAGDFVKKGAGAQVIVIDAGLVLLVAVEIGVAPARDGPGRVQHLLRHAVHRALHVVQARRHLNVRHGELHVHVKEGPLDEKEPAGSLGRDPVLEDIERLASGVQHGGVHQPGEVSLELRDRGLLDGGRCYQIAGLGVWHVRLDQLHEVVAAPANLLGLDGEDLSLLLDVLGLERGELLEGDEFIPG